MFCISLLFVESLFWKRATVIRDIVDPMAAERREQELQERRNARAIRRRQMAEERGGQIFAESSSDWSEGEVGRQYRYCWVVCIVFLFKLGFLRCWFAVRICEPRLRWRILCLCQDVDETNRTFGGSSQRISCSKITLKCKRVGKHSVAMCSFP